MKTFLYIITVFVAASFGVMLYISIQKDIPESFAFLKVFGGSTTENFETDPLPGATLMAKGWGLFSSPENPSYIELRRYDRRSRVYISYGCNAKQPFLQVYVPDAFALAPTKARPVLEFATTPFIFDINSKLSSALAKNPEKPTYTPQIALAQQPLPIAQLLLAAPNHKLRMNYLLQSDKTFEPSYLNIPTQGFTELLSYLPKSCQPPLPTPAASAASSVAAAIPASR